MAHPWFESARQSKDSRDNARTPRTDLSPTLELAPYDAFIVSLSPE